jgi:hypothetical protein
MGHRKYKWVEQMGWDFPGNIFKGVSQEENKWEVQKQGAFSRSSVAQFMVKHINCDSDHLGGTLSSTTWKLVTSFKLSNLSKPLIPYL